MIDQHLATGAGVTVAGDPRPDRPGRRVRRHRARPPTARRFAPSARSRPIRVGLRGRTRLRARLDGQLRLQRRPADRGRHHRRRRRRRRSTTSAATSSRCSSSAARRASGTSPRATCPARATATATYWRDVGTLDAYYDAHMDLISVEPVFNLYNEEWPILTWHEPLPPAKFVFDEPGRVGQALNSLVCAGVVVSGGTVGRSILSPRRARPFACGGRAARCSCTASTSAVVPSSGTRSSTRTSRIEPGAQVGVDAEADRKRFVVSDGGVVVIGKGDTVDRLTCERRAPHPRVPARGLRRRRRARRVPRARAREARRRDRPLLGRRAAARRAAARRSSPTRRGSALAGPSPPCGRARRPCRSTWRWPRRVEGADLVHSHTWYANLGGHLAKLIYGIPHVVDRAQPRADATVEGRAARRRLRALELLRADRARGRGRDRSPSPPSMRRDVLACYPAIDPARVHVIYNGIDTEEYAPDPATDVLERHGVDPAQPSVVFVGPDHAAEGPHAPARRGARDRPGRAARALRRRARHARDRSRDRARRSSAFAPSAATSSGSSRCSPKRRGDPAPQPRDGVRLPVDLRAARHRQPRGDGVRGGRRRDGDRRDPGGRRGRRHRAARAVRAARRRLARAGRPGARSPRAIAELA